jgi:hypothetical protein
MFCILEIVGYGQLQIVNHWVVFLCCYFISKCCHRVNCRVKTTWNVELRVNSFQSTGCYPMSSWFILILSSHICLQFLNGLPSCQNLHMHFSISHPCYMPHPSHSSRFHDPNSSLWGMQSLTLHCNRCHSNRCIVYIKLNTEVPLSEGFFELICDHNTLYAFVVHGHGQSVQLYNETMYWFYINYLQIVHRHTFKILLTLKSAQCTKTVKCTGRTIHTIRGVREYNIESVIT